MFSSNPTDNVATGIDLLWESEVCPESTAIIHRSTQGPNQLKIETIQPPVRTCCQGLFSVIAFTITSLYLALTISLLFLVAPTFYGGLAPGPGFLIILWIEMPLIIGAFTPLAMDMFTRHIEPLITKEILELDIDNYTYSRELHPRWLQIFRRRSYVAVASGGDTSELAGVELLTDPQGLSTSLFLAAGFEFGVNIGPRDAEVVRDAIRAHIRSIGLTVLDPPPANRPPKNPCYALTNDENGVSIAFGMRDSVLLLVGYLSLWTLPLSLVVPLLPFVGYDVRDGPGLSVPDEPGMDYPGVYASDSQMAPGVLWAGFHSIIYLWWTLEYLTTLTLTLDKATFTARRTIKVLPCLRLPFIIMDGLFPTFWLSRPLSDISMVNCVEAPMTTLCIHLLHRRCRTREMLLPSLTYHELIYLEWLIKDAVRAGAASNIVGRNVVSIPTAGSVFTLENLDTAGGDVESGHMPSPVFGKPVVAAPGSMPAVTPWRPTAAQGPRWHSNTPAPQPPPAAARPAKPAAAATAGVQLQPRFGSSAAGASAVVSAEAGAAGQDGATAWPWRPTVRHSNQLGDGGRDAHLAESGTGASGVALAPQHYPPPPAAQLHPAGAGTQHNSDDAAPRTVATPAGPLRCNIPPAHAAGADLAHPVPHVQGQEVQAVRGGGGTGARPHVTAAEAATAAESLAHAALDAGDEQRWTGSAIDRTAEASGWVSHSADEQDAGIGEVGDDGEGALIGGQADGRQAAAAAATKAMEVAENEEERLIAAGTVRSSA